MPIETHLAKKFPYVYAWNKHMGSHDYYINDQLWLAEEDDAPPTAIYRRSETKKWATISEVVDPEIKAILHDYVANKLGVEIGGVS